jgi:hypothetical protein
MREGGKFCAVCCVTWVTYVVAVAVVVLDLFVWRP